MNNFQLSKVGKTKRPGTMNRWEADYVNKYLEPERCAKKIAGWFYEGVKFKLAKRTWYTPDFLVLLPDGRIEIHEVKGGFIRDDAKVKLKIAAEKYAAFNFILAQKTSSRAFWKRTKVEIC